MVQHWQMLAVSVQMHVSLNGLGLGMRVLVVGGYGMIGLSILGGLIADGHDVTALGRDASWGQSREERCRWVAGDIARMLSAADWLPLLADIDIVVNVSGALQTGFRDNLENLQYRAMVALCQVAAERTHCLFIQISAPGATEDAPIEFLSSKGRADAFLRSSGMKWVILKPALVIAPHAYGGTALLRMLAAIPVILPLVHARSRVATVDIGEVVEAVRLSIAGKIAPGSDLEIAADESLALEDVVAAFRRWLGYAPPCRIIHLPNLVATVVGKLADGLGLLGWRSPLRSTALSVMADGVTVNPHPYMDASGRNPHTLADTMRAMPASVQERWFARLYLMMPIAIAVLSAFWLTSGLIGLLRLQEAATILVQGGFRPALAAMAVATGAVADVLLGLLVLFRPVTRTALAGMIAMTAVYLLAATVWFPDLWADPLGPLVKSIPAAFLALVAMQLVETR